MTDREVSAVRQVRVSSKSPRMVRLVFERNVWPGNPRAKFFYFFIAPYVQAKIPSETILRSGFLNVIEVFRIELLKMELCLNKWYIHVTILMDAA
jgi:hypothetical protein